MSNVEIDAEAVTQADTKWWREEWLKFPTVSRDEEGNWQYWDVPVDTGVYNDDRTVGEAMARDTVAQMQRFPEGSSVLRRIIRDIDLNSSAAQGFVNRLEDMLTRPDVYLESLEPGAVRAKLRGTG
jgi:hypothetical protein